MELEQHTACTRKGLRAWVCKGVGVRWVYTSALTHSHLSTAQEAAEFRSRTELKRRESCEKVKTSSCPLNRLQQWSCRSASVVETRRPAAWPIRRPALDTQWSNVTDQFYIHRHSTRDSESCTFVWLVVHNIASSKTTFHCGARLSDIF